MLGGGREREEGRGADLSDNVFLLSLQVSFSSCGLDLFIFGSFSHSLLAKFPYHFVLFLCCLFSSFPFCLFSSFSSFPPLNRLSFSCLLSTASFYFSITHSCHFVFFLCCLFSSFPFHLLSSFSFSLLNSPSFSLSIISIIFLSLH